MKLLTITFLFFSLTLSQNVHAGKMTFGKDQKLNVIQPEVIIPNIYENGAVEKDTPDLSTR